MNFWDVKSKLQILLEIEHYIKVIINLVQNIAGKVTVLLSWGPLMFRRSTHEEVKIYSFNCWFLEVNFVQSEQWLAHSFI